MSSSRYYGQWDHAKGGHRITYRCSTVGPTRVHIQDPCPFGLREVLAVAPVRPGFVFGMCSYMS